GWAAGAMASTRRLVAILAADVAGYSRLMGADEEGTHERLTAHLVELVDPKIEEHHGGVVKTTGDGLLVEFASVVDAPGAPRACSQGQTSDLGRRTTCFVGSSTKGPSRAATAQAPALEYARC